MNLVLEFIIPLVTFLAGSGGAWLFFFRARIRREGNTLKEADFNSLSSVVERSSHQIAELSEKVREMETIRTQLVFQVEELKRENATLKALIEQLNVNNNHEQLRFKSPKIDPTSRKRAPKRGNPKNEG